MNSSDDCWKHTRCYRFRISLNHLKIQVASKILTMGGWKMEGGHEWIINKYCLKHPVYNLESIYVAMHPQFNDIETTICPSYYPNDCVRNSKEKYCDDAEFVESAYLEDFKEQECFYVDTEKLGALMPDTNMVNRDWGAFKHKVVHISIHNLKDSVKRAILYQTGWLTDLSATTDELKIATSIYSLNCTNSNLWSFRILDESVESSTNKEWTPDEEEHNENEKKHTNSSKNNQEHHNTGKTLDAIFSEIKEKLENKKNDKYNYLNKKRLFQSELCKLPELKFDKDNEKELIFNENKNISRCESAPPTTNSNLKENLDKILQEENLDNIVQEDNTIDATKFFDYQSQTDSCSSMPPLIDDTSSDMSYPDTTYPVMTYSEFNDYMDKTNNEKKREDSDMFVKRDVIEDDSEDYNYYRDYSNTVYPEID